MRRAAPRILGAAARLDRFEIPGLPVFCRDDPLGIGTPWSGNRRSCPFPDQGLLISCLERTSLVEDSSESEHPDMAVQDCRDSRPG
jgi:hypothetical protein